MKLFLLVVRCMSYLVQETNRVQKNCAMAQKSLCITSANGDQRIVSVLDTTTVREIMQQCHADVLNQDRRASLIRGVTLLEPDLTVSDAGLEDADELSLLWSDPFVEMVRWSGEKTNEDLYVQIPPNTIMIPHRAFHISKLW